MRFHVVALPHTRTRKDYSICAYTMKVLNFCKMMKSLGHTVFHYGAEGSEVEADEHITIITTDEQEKYYGKWSNDNIPNIEWDPNLPPWRIANGRACAEMGKRLEPTDFICLIGGSCQKPIADFLGSPRVVEFGVGYYGIFSRFKVFESYTHQATCYALLSRDPNGSPYDCVIPNYYDTNDYPFVRDRDPGDYLLFLARVIRRKGIEIAWNVAKKSGLKLIIAGPGVKQKFDTYIATVEGLAIPIDDKIQYVGSVTGEQKIKLLSNAKALIQPTIFMEPFGGCVVEAQLCGIPVITSDYAAFSETVEHSKTGFRCRIMPDYLEAVEKVSMLDREYIRSRAMSLYSLDVVRYKYQKYFESLEHVLNEESQAARSRGQ